jgi:uncharacterized protein YunC (DUF1805 family)
MLKPDNGDEASHWVCAIGQLPNSVFLTIRKGGLLDIICGQLQMHALELALKVACSSSKLGYRI